MPAAAHPPAAARARSPWFHSAPFDLVLLLGVPFLTWPLVTAAQLAWGPALLTQLILLTATGHYFATFVRTYGDRDLFARFRLRFVAAPPLLFAAVLLLLATGHFAQLLLATTAWAFWHWLAQAFGFARIYDIRVGSFRPLTAWLDKALVLAGFVSAIALNDGALAELGKVFLDAGVPLPTAAQFAGVRTAVLLATLAVGVAYLGNLGATIARRQPWSWQKQVMHATTIGYYWFAFAWLPNVLVAYVLYELFHDVQYYAITWLTCRQRVQRPNTTAWLQRLFRPGFGAAVLFVLAMTAFGALDFGGRQLAEGTPLRQASLALFLTAALLHYYYDGFIWKARESATASDLGIAGGLRAAVVPSLRHGLRWAILLLPLAALLVFGNAPPASARARAQALVALAPGDFLNQSQLGLELARARELPAALAHYRASIAANPEFAQSRLNYGAALDLAGELDAAREQYQQALRCRDAGHTHAQAHVNLGVLLLLRGEAAAAQLHFASGMDMGGEHPIGRMLGLAAAVPTEAVDRRAALYAAILQLEPGQPDACLNLGNLLLAQRRFEPAAAHFAAALQRAPDCVPGMVGLAAAQAALGRADEARRSVQAALHREPGNAAAMALQQRLLQR